MKIHRSLIATSMLAIIVIVGVVISMVSYRSLEQQKSSATDSNSTVPADALVKTSGDSGAVSVASGNKPDASALAFRWDEFGEMMRKNHAKELISREDGERFLRAKGSTAMNLLAVATATGDEEFARRAAKLFPHDPAVQHAVLARDLFPEQQAEWIARFKESSPDSPIPSLYAAIEAFNRQDSASALEEVSVGVEKPGLYMWMNEFNSASQALYEFKGFSSLEAQLLSAFAQPSSHLGVFPKLGGELLMWHTQALEKGDNSRAERSLQLAYGVCKLFQSPEGNRTMLNQIVGTSLEMKVLKAVPAGIEPAFLSVPRSQREAEITGIRNVVRDATSEVMVILTKQDPALLSRYLELYRTEGEFEAVKWLKRQIQ